MSSRRHGSSGALYAALAVEPTATAEEIRAAYRKLALEKHPDKNPGDPDAEARFQVLNAAYEVLKDPERRSRYDETGDEAERNDEDDVDMADFMSAFMHGNGFASGGWGQQRGPRRGPDALFDVDVTLEELYAGASKTLSVDKSVRCGLCTGSGGKAGRKRQTCSSCGGEGYKYVSKELFMGVLHSRAVDCPGCRGTGKRFRPQDQCPPCQGKGLVPHKRDLDVKIERGQPPDEVIELEGEADEAPDGGPAGNLILRLHVLPHPSFAFAPSSTRDLVCEISLTLSESLLGFSRVVLRHLDGRELRVQQPGPGAPGYRVLQRGDVVKVAGKGMPSRYGQAGDLLIRIRVDDSMEDWLRRLPLQDLQMMERILPPRRPTRESAEADVELVQLRPASLSGNATQDRADPVEETTSATCLVQ